MRKFRNLLCILIMGYLLGIQNGWIALWEDGNPEPERVFPYRAESLPPEDQKALAKGIHLDEDSALIKLLEDYLS